MVSRLTKKEAFLVTAHNHNGYRNTYHWGRDVAVKQHTDNLYAGYRSTMESLGFLTYDEYVQLTAGVTQQ
jgi:hypothetical protein